MKSLDILIMLRWNTWLKVSISARIHTKERAIAIALVIRYGKRTEHDSHKERYIVEEQDSAERTRKGEMI